MPERNHNNGTPLSETRLLLWAILSLSVTVKAFQLATVQPTRGFANVRQSPTTLVVSTLRSHRYSSSSSALQSSHYNNVIDAEFERAPASDDDNSDDKTAKAKARPKSLLDLSLESGDPRWKQARIPFVDTVQQTAIDGTLAFLVNVQGVEYGIATPCDAAAAITREDPDGTVTNLSPDDDENMELCEIMAAQLVEHVHADLSLKKTPRVLTITGDLDQYTDNVEDTLLPKPHATESFLDDADEDEKWFHDFMRQELGEEEYLKTMNEPATAESLGEELMELFEVPGLGTRSDDVGGVEDMLKSLLEEVDPLESVGIDEQKEQHDAIKLVSYHFGNGKAYSLVRLLKPYTLVGRLIQTAPPSNDNDLDDSSDDDSSEETFHFELLTKEEEKLVLPKMEEVCRKELTDAGLDLAP